MKTFVSPFRYVGSMEKSETLYWKYLQAKKELPPYSMMGMTSDIPEGAVAALKKIKADAENLGISTKIAICFIKSFSRASSYLHLSSIFFSSASRWARSVLILRSSPRRLSRLSLSSLYLFSKSSNFSFRYHAEAQVVNYEH